MSIIVVSDLSEFAERLLTKLIAESGLHVSAEMVAYITNLCARSIELDSWLSDDDESHREFTLLFDLQKERVESPDDGTHILMRLGDLALLRLALFWDWVVERGLTDYYVEVGSSSYLSVGEKYLTILKPQIPSIRNTVFHQLGFGFEDISALMWDMFISEMPRDEKLFRRIKRFSSGDNRYGRGILSATGVVGSCTE
jgi:hypothetical protein